jgi:hypothetical protein
VDKDVGRAVGRSDEAKALGAVEPLDRALLGAGAGRCKYKTNTISTVAGGVGMRECKGRSLHAEIERKKQKMK